VSSKKVAKSDGDPLKFLIQFWAEPVNFKWGTADASVATAAARVGNRLVPNRIVVTTSGVDGQPSLRLKLEVIGGIPECRFLSLTSDEAGRAVRQLDLDRIKLNEWVADTFAAFAFERRGVAFERLSSKPTRIGPDADDEGNLLHPDTWEEDARNSPIEAAWAGEAQDIAAANDFQRARRGKGARIVNEQVIKEAVAIYKQHFNDHPKQAIAQAFGVSERTASAWLTRARSPEFGLLPPTKPGQKKM
jgi:hypothetical protein